MLKQPQSALVVRASAGLAAVALSRQLGGRWITTIIAKARFALHDGEAMTLLRPEAPLTHEQPPTSPRTLWQPSEAAPYLTRCDVYVAGQPAAASAPHPGRLRIERDGKPLLDKHDAWPGAYMARPHHQRKRSEVLADLTTARQTIDWEILQAAPHDQQIDHLQGDEWLVVGQKTERRCSRFPDVNVRAKLQCDGANKEVFMLADTLSIQQDAGSCSLCWRGYFESAAKPQDGEVLCNLSMTPSPAVASQAASTSEFDVAALPTLLAHLPGWLRTPQSAALPRRHEDAALPFRVPALAFTAPAETLPAPTKVAVPKLPPILSALALRARVLDSLDSGQPLAGLDLRGADLSRIDFAGNDLSNCNLSNARLNHAILAHCDLRAANLTDSQLMEADLRGANLAAATVHRADLSRARLDDADFSDAQGTACQFTGSIARRACFSGGRWDRADFSDALLQRSDFGGATMREACFDRSALTAASLQGADAAAARFVGAELERLILEKAVLNDCVFNGAQACRIHARGAMLRRATFIDASLRHAQLATACAASAIFRKSDLRYADLTDAILDDCDFSDAAMGGCQLPRSLAKAS